MSTALFVVQCFNGLQLGVLLFLVAAGLTLVFGVMDFINLAHGVQYMLGAYLAVAFYRLTGNFFAAVALALPASLPRLAPPFWSASRLKSSFSEPSTSVIISTRCSRPSA